MDRYRVLTWHVHGAYLESLAATGHELYLPVRPDGQDGYGGCGTATLPATVHEVPVDELASLDIDVVLYQSRQHFIVDRHEVLSAAQRRLPSIYLEHDPPREHPTDTRHPVDDPGVLLVHCTDFNALMWDSGRTPVRVIDHGVRVPDGIRWTGELPRGVSAINNLDVRGRRLGADVYLRLREEIAVDLVGMGSDRLGGLGALNRFELPSLFARYHFYLHPVPYTSLAMALIEAMMSGLPVVGLATTELPTVIRNGENGFVATNPDELVEPMRRLASDRELAGRLGAEARRTAIARFGIERFARDWTDAFRQVAGPPRRRTISIPELSSEAAP